MYFNLMLHGYGVKGRVATPECGAATNILSGK